LLLATITALQKVCSQRVLTYEEFIKNVSEKNIEFIVEKYNVSIIEAYAQAAKIFPDPDFSFSYENNQDRSLQMGQIYAAELGYTLELGGKRKARMAVAQSEKQITAALVEDFFRNLRADATLCFLEALKQKRLVDLALSSYESMKELARADSIRFRLGEISEVNALQSRLEATTMMTEYIQVETVFKNMLSDLAIFEGGVADLDIRQITSLQGNLQIITRTFNLKNLIDLAQTNRADLQAAVRNRELSAANVKLAKANRVIDLGLNIGFAHNTIVLNEIAPAPKFNAVSAGVSIPLKFSNKNKGQLLAAQFSERQAEAQYDAVLLQIRIEVEQRYNSYISACRQAELYKNNTLSDATTILEKKKISYSRGETSLLEVLDAQRTANEVYQNYYEALFNANASLVELNRAVGIWEVEF